MVQFLIYHILTSQTIGFLGFLILIGVSMQEGLAMIDDGHRDGKRRYWFPCVSSISTSVVSDI